MKSIYLIVPCLLSTIWANCIPLPSEMQVHYKYFSSSKTVEVKADEKTLATVYRKPISWTTQYLLENEAKQPVARADLKSKYLFEVEDEKGKLIGRIQSIPLSTPTLEVFSSQGTAIAKARLNGWHTKWKITDYEERHTLATLECSNFQNSRDWTMKIEDNEVFTESHFHPHLTLFLIAFQAGWQDSDELDPSLKKELLLELGTYEEDLKQENPQEMDFLLVENLTEACLENQTLYETLKCCLSFLDSDHLNDSQKAALYYLLDYRLKTTFPCSSI